MIDAEAVDAADAERWSADVTLAFGEQAKLTGYGFDGRLLIEVISLVGNYY